MSDVAVALITRGALRAANFFYRNAVQTIWPEAAFNSHSPPAVECRPKERRLAEQSAGLRALAEPMSSNAQASNAAGVVAKTACSASAAAASQRIKPLTLWRMFATMLIERCLAALAAFPQTKRAGYRHHVGTRVRSVGQKDERVSNHFVANP
jgi:hypothetical protein